MYARAAAAAGVFQKTPSPTFTRESSMESPSPRGFARLSIHVTVLGLVDECPSEFHAIAAVSESARASFNSPLLELTGSSKHSFVVLQLAAPFSEFC